MLVSPRTSLTGLKPDSFVDVGTYSYRSNMISTDYIFAKKNTCIPVVIACSRLGTTHSLALPSCVLMAHLTSPEGLSCFGRLF